MPGTDENQRRDGDVPSFGMYIGGEWVATEAGVAVAHHDGFDLGI